MTIKINASDILKAQQCVGPFKKQISVEEFANSPEIKKLIDSGLMIIEPNRSYKQAVNTLKRKIK